jgi:hypothetical protein
MTDHGFDPDALRAKYREEREKRLRADGNDQYREVKGELARFVDDPYVEPGFTREPLCDEVQVAVIGGGFGGLLAGARLREAGVESIRVIDAASDFGGTWYWNRYPGIACDVEAYIYLPLLEEVRYLPTQKYADGAEILAYSQTIARYFDLYRDACFQTRVEHLTWDETASQWIVATHRGDRIRAQGGDGADPEPAEAARRPRHRRLRGHASTPVAGTSPPAAIRSGISRDCAASAWPSSAPARRRYRWCRTSPKRRNTSTCSSAHRPRWTSRSTPRPIRSGRRASRPAGTSSAWTTSTPWCRAASSPWTW